MDLEEKKVRRKDIFSNPRYKEWWYTGCYDKNENLYFSFYFVRVPFLDSVKFTVFDLNKDTPFTYSKKLFLDSSQKKNKLDLHKRSKEIFISYSGDEVSGWVFDMQAKNFSASLKIEPTEPYFTKFDNNFINEYALLHFMKNKVMGQIVANGITYKITNGLGYYDHCFGKVPRKTFWHWLAVQNENLAFVSLINYGSFSQKYTEVLVKGRDGRSSWIRLNQEVSFEYTSYSKKSKWRLTSCDNELEITILMVSKSKEDIPPIVPIFINLKHDEYYVKVNGRVKIDNIWIDTGEMYGVMEEHCGKW
ncbi:DUF2804 family protein [Clostridium cellulovorans]|uniref:AttH domain-containing protein n=1 Tax=Clostridium cellulovorans (strain ATCC 35296 / DSM 3052 / OCM 3 / 743B) TaxID=573061 RepID=D9SQQ6_CLOC7|nr:DUF2804 family protein [Clostridium cellulovorans]ADL52262.1 Protein of unknown function DUF2804 [Clostridium cellulovorans 743B]